MLKRFRQISILSLSVEVGAFLGLFLSAYWAILLGFHLAATVVQGVTDKCIAFSYSILSRLSQ